MYFISLVILVGAEFNAMLFPRAMLGKELIALSSPKTVELELKPRLYGLLTCAVPDVSNY